MAYAELTELVGCDCALLTREMAHRTANVLQQAIGAIHLCRRGSPTALDDAMTALDAASALHHALNYAPSGLVDAKEALDAACMAALGAIVGNAHITLEVDATSTLVRAASLRPLVLATAELVMNAAKHAFRDRAAGVIRVALTDDETICNLSVSDDGHCEGWLRPGGQGNGIVDALVHSTGGRIFRSLSSTGSSCVKMTMPSIAAAALQTDAGT